jgi:type IV pilus assembly protein PilQ
VTIQAVEVPAASPGAATVVIKADGPVGSYESFALPDPPRVVVDIPNATARVRVPPALPKESPLARIRASQYRERPTQVTRVVIDLRTALPYRIEAAREQLRVEIGEVPPGVAVEPAEGRVTRVDFTVQRSRARVTIGTRGKVTYTSAEIAEPPGLLLDIDGALVEPEASRAFSVPPGTGPIRQIRAAQYQREPRRVVRVLIDFTTPTKPQVSQTAQGIVVEVPIEPAVPVPPPAPPAVALPAPPAPPPPAPPPVPAVPPPAPPAVALPAPPVTAPPPRVPTLSMDFREADLLNLLRIIAEVGGVNIAAGTGVTGKVTIRLIDVPWDQALDVILRTNNLAAEREGNIIRVAPPAVFQGERDLAQKRQEAELTARKTLSERQVEVEALETVILPVNYAKVSEIQKGLDRLKSARRADASVTADERTSSIIITDTPTVIARMRELLKKLDIPTPQVMIEARIVEIDQEYTRQLGVQFGGRVSPPRGPGQNVFLSDVFGGSAGAGVIPPGGAQSPPANPIPFAVNLPVSGATGGLGLLIGTVTNRALLNAQLSFLESQRKSRTLSTPKVATLDNEKAEVKSGRQVPFTTVDASGRTVVQFTDASLRLTVTPHVTADRSILMTVDAENSTEGAIINLGPTQAIPINTKRATTKVLVENGGTTVIGGLIQTFESLTEERLPYLGQIPILGYLFRKTSENVEPKRTELLIFITPTILETRRAG